MGAGANICPQTAVALDAVSQARNKGVVKENGLVIAIGTASGIKFSELGEKGPVVVNGTIEDIEKTVQVLHEMIEFKILKNQKSAKPGWGC